MKFSSCLLVATLSVVVSITTAFSEAMTDPHDESSELDNSDEVQDIDEVSTGLLAPTTTASPSEEWSTEVSPSEESTEIEGDSSDDLSTTDEVLIIKAFPTEADLDVSISTEVGNPAGLPEIDFETLMEYFLQAKLCNMKVPQISGISFTDYYCNSYCLAIGKKSGKCKKTRCHCKR